MSRPIVYVLSKAGHGAPIGAMMVPGNPRWHLGVPEWRACSLEDAPTLARHAYWFATLTNQTPRARLELDATALDFVDRAAYMEGLRIRRSFEIDAHEFHSLDDVAFAQVLEGARELSASENIVD